MKRSSLPTVSARAHPGDGDADASGGTENGNGAREPVGVDPELIYAAYRDDLVRQGLSPLPYDEFTYTDLTVYSELRRMKTLDEPVPAYCVHLKGAPGDGADGPGDVPMDDETVEQVGDEVLREVMQAALRGNPAARDELLDLADRTADGGERLDRLWGGLGLDKLRGTTPRTRRVDWWQRWLTDVLASKLDATGTRPTSPPPTPTDGSG